MAQPLFVRPITDEERETLTAGAGSAKKDEAWRAKVILLSAEGRTTAEISKSLGFHQSNVKKWIRKYNADGIEGLAVRKRGPKEGPKPRFSPGQIERILELYKSEPVSMGYSFSRWTTQKLAAAAVERGIVERISHVTVRQILMRSAAPSAAGGASLPQKALRSLTFDASSGSDLEKGQEALERCEFARAVEYLGKALSEMRLSEEEQAITRSLLSRALEEVSQLEESYEAIKPYEAPASVSRLQAPTRAFVKLRLGWANSGQGRNPEAIAHLNEAKRLFQELGDELGVSEVHLALGCAYERIDEFAIARDHFLAAIDSQRTNKDSRLLARIYDGLGTADFYAGTFSGAKQSYLKALELAEGCRNANLLGRILLNLGTTYHLGHLAQRRQSVGYFRRAIDFLERGGNRADLATAYNNLADDLRDSGLWDEALDYLNKSIDVATLLRDPRWEATARLTYAEIMFARGAYPAAEAHLMKVLELVNQGADKWVEAHAVRILGGVRRAQGQLDESRNVLRRSLQTSTSIGDLHGVSLAHIGLAEVHFAQGDYPRAREYLEFAKKRLQEEQSLYLSGLIQRLAGQLEAASGRLAEAKQHVAQSISIFTTTGIPYEVARSQYQMAHILEETGDLSYVRTCLLNAHEAFVRLGAQPEADLTSEALSRQARYETEIAPHEPQSIKTHGIGDEASDILLMERLIEASKSRELLLEELGSIIYESFAVVSLVVCGVGEDQRSEAFHCWGIDDEAATQICRSLLPGRSEIEREEGTFRVFRIKDDSPLPAVLLINFHSLPNLARLQPLLKQAELGLEACRLRVASRTSLPAKPSKRVQTVIPGFIVANDLMFQVIENIHKIRTSDVTVLITGESGTGKELIARAIHAESARAAAMFIPFNCTATPKELIDSQLFGHRRGAFTGATANYTGVIRAAEGGTLFLDEIGDFALEMQPKLMRFLQEGEIQPLGEARPIKVDVRVIAATNSDLEKAVEEGRFREDLFHRLNIIRIHVPPLRERPDEVSILATSFLEQLCSRAGKRGLTFTQEALEALSAYVWPGNVRQLRNEVERVVAYAADGAQISVKDLSREIVSSARASFAVAVGANRQASADAGRAGQSAVPTGSTGHAVDGSDGSAGRNRGKLKDAVAELERRLIMDALTRNGNNLSRSAIELGLSRRGLRLKLAQYRLR